MSHYDEVLNDLRERGQTLACEYIAELYNILEDEEKLTPEDCRAKIEHDCIDLWSKATIRKYLPPEAKDPKKKKAGKIGADIKKEKLAEAAQIIEQTNDGQNVARINLAENDSDDKKERESKTFYDELDEMFSSRPLSPELLEANRIIEEKNQKISELEHLLLNKRPGEDENENINHQLYMPYNLAKQIYDTIGDHLITEPSFNIEHDGFIVTAIQNLGTMNGYHENNTMA